MRSKSALPRRDRRWLWLAASAVFVLGVVLAAVLPVQGQPAQRTLPVFTVSKAGLTGAESARLQKAFGLGQVVRNSAGVVRYVDPTSFLALPTVALPAKEVKREEGERDKVLLERLDLEAIGRLRVRDPKEALAATEKALRTAGLLPEGASPDASHTRFEAVDAQGKRLADQALDTAVSYRFTLGGLPLQGPGAKVRVAYGPDGKVTQLAYAVRRFAPAGKIAVLDPDKGRQRCAEWSHTPGGSRSKVAAADLAYYAPALAAKVTRLEPSYRCRLVDENGASAQVFFVPAAVNARRPALPVAQPARRASAMALAANPIEVGSEGTGPCSGLPSTGINVGAFNSHMASGGVPVAFSWLDANAWEDDWKEPSLAGHDSNWVDDVDMAYWQGHGSPEGFSLSGCSSIDDTSVEHADARWGNRDAEWMSLFTCLILAEESGGQRWWQRWGPTFQGLHQINSFHTVSYHSAVHGGIYAEYLKSPQKVVSAWAQTSIDDQPAEVVWASMGVIGPGGLVNYNDFFWGRGPVGPDVPAAQITGFWRLSGSS
ncbi:MAG: hypothetical protein QOH06_2045 [Acidobacteriota bacterium]|nr:hypothetical protein [Acidobacteriota bacterium]